MALQLRRGETRSFGKVVIASFLAMAFALQALVALNIPSVFALGDSVGSLAAPTNPYPADNSAIATNDFWFTWSAVPGAVSYEWQGSTSNTKDSDGNLANIMWTGDYQGAQPISPTEHSVGASGTWYWQVRAVGLDGTKGAWSSVWKMTIDMNLPAAPSNLAWQTSTNQPVADGGSTNAYAGTASWQDATPSKVDHYIYKYWNDIVGNPYKVGSEYTTTTTGTSLAGVFNQGEGAHHFCVAAVDTAGNASACTPFMVTYDITAPHATFTYSNNNGNALTNDDVTVTMTASEPTQTPTGWTRLSDTQFTRGYSDNGKYQVTLTDLAGNVSTPQNFEVKRIDRNAPTISGVSDGAVVSGAVKLSIFDPKYEGYDGFDAAHGLTADGAVVATTNGPNKTYEYTVSGEGQHTVVATDKAGNATTISFTIDTTAPVISGVGVDHPLTNLNTLVVSGTVSDANLKDYNLRIYNADKTLVSPWMGMTGTANVSNGELGQFDISKLPDGQYWVRIWADDLAGNQTGIASPMYIPFTIDRTAPNVKIAGVTRNSDGTYTVTGTTDDPSSVTVTIDSRTPLTVTPSAGAWSVTSGVLLDGSHSVTAESTDAAGNESITDYPFTVSSGDTKIEQFSRAIAAAQSVRLFGTIPAVATGATGSDNSTTDQSVLGDQTTTPSGKASGSASTNSDEAVKGVSTTRTQPAAGLAWYWWIVIVVAALGLWWFFAWRRHKRSA